jgi:hypothetical protein
MRKTLMASVAVAALLSVTGLATAQSVNQGSMKGSESPAAASPKGDAVAPTNAPAAKGADNKVPGAASKEPLPQHAQGQPDTKATGEMKADGKSKASDSTAPASKDVKSPTAETKSTSDSKTAGETKVDSKSTASDSATPASKDIKTPTAETKSTSDSKTTGNASATAAPPAEKRTQITSAIKQEKVEEVTNVNFNLSLGTMVPAGVRYHPLPSRIVEIYPEWRGYDFILVHGRYIILRPQTHEIVYIIEG